MREKKSEVVKAKPWVRIAAGLISLVTLFGITLLYTHEREENDFSGLVFAFASMAMLFGYIAFTGKNPGWLDRR